MRHRDETGVALALAIIVVVIMGAMGAGLLLVVRDGLEADIAAANARRALYSAESGTRLAARHLLSDPRTEAYDSLPDFLPTGCRPPPTNTDSEDTGWSHTAGGESGTISGAGFRTGISALGAGCGTPQTVAGKRYFGVYSEGTFRDARRLVEAVYTTTDIGAPLAVYAAGKVSLGGSSSVSDGSVFAGGDVEVEPGASVSGQDTAYGDWSAGGSTRRNETEAAVAAVGRVSGETEVPVYDSGTTPTFSSEVAPGRLSFPFDHEFWSDDRLSSIEATARAQGNYSEGNITSWPQGATDSTVVYVAADEVVVNPGICGEVCRGTLVVAGDARLAGVVFEGVVVSAGDALLEEGTRVQGAVVAGGDMEVYGEVVASGAELRLRPGHFGVEVYGWREPTNGDYFGAER